jgi:DNA-binding CsgD family transcriptional regulator
MRILTRIVDGKLNKQIAGKLNVAEQTIKLHFSTMFKKFSVSTQTQAAVLVESSRRHPAETMPEAVSQAQQGDPTLCAGYRLFEDGDVALILEAF